MKRKVLVVEDEPLLLLAAVDLVEEAGFEALEASNAADAVPILETVPEVCILFTDIDMPGGMDGLNLAVSVRDCWPPMEIIVGSGMKMPRPDDLPSRGVFFAKPCDSIAVTKTLVAMAA
ncbi:response regulator [Rhizobium sp. BK251]|uniref:response regulator n=1 Tax=Rhizobium sp. BK251 TaxID=2512125 RepID=UPI00104E0F3C|nr:response regulator [Rhizobium sp. BK251]TCL65851.1 response regulator receiver domain-containing protein [Rhizobium sp. BK251]